MAEKFGRSRWVREGYLDNRVPGCVVGQIGFAGLGFVDLYLRGDCKGELTGKAFRFRNPRFVEEDFAVQALAEFEIPQVGEVSLISFDPHPMLSPHPYIEWFSLGGSHYRIELEPEDARILTDSEAAELDERSRNIRVALGR
jgi:hypothetical protein